MLAFQTLVFTGQEVTTGSLDSGLASTDSPTSELEAWDMEVELELDKEEE